MMGAAARGCVLAGLLFAAGAALAGGGDPSAPESAAQSARDEAATTPAATEAEAPTQDQATAGAPAETENEAEPSGEAEVTLEGSSPEEQEAYRRLLAKYDLDGDGALDEEERSAVMKDALAKIQLQQARKQKRREQAGLAAKSPSDLSPQQQRQLANRLLLQRFDRDRNGTLDEAEQQRADEGLAQMTHEPRAAGEAKPQPRVHFGAFIKAYDQDGDGRLDADERAAALSGLVGPATTGGDASGSE